MAGGLTPRWQNRKPLQTNTLEFFCFFFSKIKISVFVLNNLVSKFPRINLKKSHVTKPWSLISKSSVSTFASDCGTFYPVAHHLFLLLHTSEIHIRTFLLSKID